MFSLLLLLHWPRRIMKDIRQLDKLLSPLFHCLFMASFMFMITIIVTIMKKENKFSLSANIIFTITKDNIGACLYSGPPRFPFVFFYPILSFRCFCSWKILLLAKSSFRNYISVWDVFLHILVHIMRLRLEEGMFSFSDSEISILCRRSDISPVHTWDSLGVRLFGSFGSCCKFW